MPDSSRSNKKPREPLDALLNHTHQAIELIEQALESRRKLTRRICDEIEQELKAAHDMLESLGPQWKFAEPHWQWWRISLDKTIGARKAERRGELVRSWKDLLELRQKLLELRRDAATLGEVGRRGDNSQEWEHEQSSH